MNNKNFTYQIISRVVLGFLISVCVLLFLLYYTSDPDFEGVWISRLISWTLIVFSIAIILGVFSVFRRLISKFKKQNLSGKLIMLCVFIVFVGILLFVFIFEPNIKHIAETELYILYFVLAAAVLSIFFSEISERVK
jgi:hypothetical protein